MSNTHAISLKRSTALLAALSLLAMLFVVNFSAFFGTASAADLTDRSLTLSSSLVGTEAIGDPGDATNGSEATHTFKFTTTDASVANVVLRYCDAAIGDCDAPVGLSLASADSSLGTVTVGDYGNGTGNQATVALDTAWSVAGAQEVDLTGVVNPTVKGTFFVRIVADADEGTVASSITEGIEITAKVAETLGFSTTAAFATTTAGATGSGVDAPGTSCSPLTGSGAITLGDPTEGTLDITKAYDNYSAFRLYTNAAGGVEVQYRGETLTRTNGGDIDAIGGTAAESALGTEQFGLAIDDSVGNNSAVPIESGSDTLDMTHVTQTADFATNGALTFETDYASGDGTLGSGALFAFVPDTATTIASTSSTGNGYTECKTAAVRYVANVSPVTTSGTYTTTIVYSAVPQY